VRKRNLITGAAAIVLSVVASSGPAMASERGVSNNVDENNSAAGLVRSDGPEGNRGDSCWINTSTGESACADSDESLAVKMLSDFGVVIEGEAPSSLKVEEPLVRSLVARGAQPRAAYLMARWYDGANYSGASWAHTTDATSTPCATPGSYTYGKVSNLSNLSFFDNWNDRISSYQGYNHCSLRLYVNAGFGGSTHGPVKNAPNLGAFDNLASSLDVRYVG
jgi:hypothetical protein